MQTFSERLIGFRKAKKLTQTDLAERIGKTKSAIAAYETGRAEPSMKDLVIMADAFECSIDELVTGREDLNLNTNNLIIERLRKVINAQAETIEHLLSGKNLVGKFKAYLMTQRVYNLDTLLGTPGLN